jgi:pantothenate kinase
VLNQSNVLPEIPQLYLQRVKHLLSTGQRVILGLVGEPGAGKSTLAQALLKTYEGIAQVVPMDGFHLANIELRRLGRAQRKGAPDTFDSAGFIALLQRLRHQNTEHVIYAPEFQREIDESIAGAIPIFPSTKLLIAEGNYLLLEDENWGQVAGFLDEVWYLEIDQVLRTSRLTKRHEIFGRSLEAAQDWVRNTDEPNAILIAQSKNRADLLFNWENS